MPATQEITQVGKREDLSDQLVVADAKKTPLTSTIRKGKKPTNTLYSWAADVEADPDTTPVPDGQPADNIEDLAGRGLLQARVQKTRVVFGVTEFAEDVSTPAGIDSEFKRSKAKALEKVKRNIEAIFSGDQDSSLVGTTHQTRGLGSWIKATAQADLPVPAEFRTPAASIYAGTLADLGEDDVLALLASIYSETGSMVDLDGFVGTELKTHLSRMTIYQPDVVGSTVVRTFFATLKDNVLSTVVDVIKGDFGAVRLHPTLWNAWNNTTKLPDTKRGYLLQLKDLEMRANKLPGFTQLPFDDSGPHGVVSAIISLKVGCPLKHGKIAAT